MIPILVSVAVYIINVPFGYWRGGVKRFSLKWFLAIHVPVGISILLRYLCNINSDWKHIVLFVVTFFMGQYTGKYIYKLKYKTTTI